MEKTNYEKMKNVPNYISLFRFICTPVMIVLFLLGLPNGLGVFLALGVYVVGSLSDMLDGYIARKYNLVSDLGSFLDQIADKFLQTSGLILLLMSGVVEPTWLAIVILSIIVLRDIEIGGIRQVAASKGVVIPADQFGKVKSFVIDCATIVLMLYLGLVQSTPLGDSAKIGAMPINYIGVFGLALLIVGTLLSLISSINYTIKAWPIIISDNSNKTQESSKQKKEVYYTASGKPSIAKTKAAEITKQAYAGEKVTKTAPEKQMKKASSKPKTQTKTNKTTIQETIKNK